ncbi:M1 family metallopeptidase [Frateuria aurantia]
MSRFPQRRLAGAVLGLLSFYGAADAAAQTTSQGFDPRETFAPYAMPQPVNSYRSGSGLPGPAYWQNRADYQLHAWLDPAHNSLRGDEVITYTNHSPDALGSLWIKLEQNIYRHDSRSVMTAPRRHNEFTDGIQLSKVELELADGRRQSLPYLVNDTRMRVDLPQAVAAHGGVVKLHLQYSYTIPGEWGGRTAHTATKAGVIDEIAQWYPRMEVYDDLRGWDTLPYLGTGEFYLEYGDFDYQVTAPSDMIVAGSGELVNPGDVLTSTEQSRLEQARNSDKTVYIIRPDEVGKASSRPKQGGELTWHFKMQQTRDVVFAASRSFIWDAARINLPDHKQALAMSVYPAEAVGKDKWDRSTEYLKGAVEIFSKQWFPYPWPVAINLAGHGAGMEYPGMVFDGFTDAGKELFMITTHEIGHTWFPMIVGSNERRNGWMDEGFNTFIDIYAHEAFNHGEFAPKRDGEYAPKGGNPVEEIQGVLKDPLAPYIIDRADMITDAYRHPLTYFKPALGLVLLREQILGRDRFDPAFRAYIRAWAFKHPSPSDFFRFMESAGGEDLSWFWRGWYEHNWNLDFAVTAVSYPHGKPEQGALVTISSLDKLVLPTTLQVDYVDGSTQRVAVPVEVWLAGGTATVPVEGSKAIRKVTIDPDQQIPDANRGNNSFVPH